MSTSVARAPFIDARAPRPEGREAGVRNAVAASNDRARVASFTRSAGVVLQSPLGAYYIAILRESVIARFSTRSPLQKLSKLHSEAARRSLSGARGGTL